MIPQPPGFLSRLGCWLSWLALAISPGQAQSDAALKSAEKKLLASAAEEHQIQSSCLNLVLESKFDALESLISEYSTTRERVHGGVWKLRHLWEGIAYPRDRNDSDSWKTLIQRLEEWNSKLATANSLNALGRAQLNYAWNGTRLNTSTTAERHTPAEFQAWARKAGTNLEAARSKDPKCIDVYRNLLQYGTTEGWPRAKMDEVFEAGIEVAPAYYETYYSMASHLTTQWHGDPGDWQRLLNTIPDRVPGPEGLIIYARTAMQVHPWNQKKFFGTTDDTVHWELMKKGFEAIVKGPDDLFNRNRMAYFACLAQDRETALPLMRELMGRDELLLEVWHSREILTKAKEWAGLEDPADPQKAEQ